MVAEAKQTVDTLLAEADPVADRQWRMRVRSSLETVAALGEPDDPWLTEVGSRIATIYVARAASMRADQRFAEGANLLPNSTLNQFRSLSYEAGDELVVEREEQFLREEMEKDISLQIMRRLARL